MDAAPRSIIVPGPYTCDLCGASVTEVLIVKPNNKKGNAGRPYTRCKNSVAHSTRQWWTHFVDGRGPRLPSPDSYGPLSAGSPTPPPQVSAKPLPPPGKVYCRFDGCLVTRINKDCVTAGGCSKCCRKIAPGECKEHPSKVVLLPAPTIEFTVPPPPPQLLPLATQGPTTLALSTPLTAPVPTPAARQPSAGLPAPRFKSNLRPDIAEKHRAEQEARRLRDAKQAELKAHEQASNCTITVVAYNAAGKPPVTRDILCNDDRKRLSITSDVLKKLKLDGHTDISIYDPLGKFPPEVWRDGDACRIVAVDAPQVLFFKPSELDVGDCLQFRQTLKSLAPTPHLHQHLTKERAQVTALENRDFIEWDASQAPSCTPAPSTSVRNFLVPASASSQPKTPKGPDPAASSRRILRHLGTIEVDSDDEGEAGDSVQTPRPLKRKASLSPSMSPTLPGPLSFKPASSGSKLKWPGDFSCNSVHAVVEECKTIRPVVPNRERRFKELTGLSYKDSTFNDAKLRIAATPVNELQLLLSSSSTPFSQLQAQVKHPSQKKKAAMERVRRRATRKARLSSSIFKRSASEEARIMAEDSSTGSSWYEGTDDEQDGTGEEEGAY